MNTDTSFKIVWQTPLVSALSVTNTLETCNKAIAAQDGAILDCGS